MPEELTVSRPVTVRVLGVDPGQRTGVAVVDVGDQAPYTVLQYTTIADDHFAAWARQLTQEVRIDAVAVEDWEHQGSARARGAMYQGFNSGRCAGILEAFGVQQLALLRRREVLKAFKVRTEEELHRQVRMFTSISNRHANKHELDAAAVAVAGVGRFGPLYSGDRFLRTPR